MQYPSKWVEKAVEAFATWPGVGKKTALRMVLFLLKEEKSKALSLGDAVRDLAQADWPGAADRARDYYPYYRHGAPFAGPEP